MTGSARPEDPEGPHGHLHVDANDILEVTSPCSVCSRPAKTPRRSSSGRSEGGSKGRHKWPTHLLRCDRSTCDDMGGTHCCTNIRARAPSVMIREAWTFAREEGLFTSGIERRPNRRPLPCHPAVQRSSSPNTHSHSPQRRSACPDDKPYPLTGPRMAHRT